MLLSLRKNGLDSLFKEVRVFKELVTLAAQIIACWGLSKLKRPGFFSGCKEELWTMQFTLTLLECF